MDNLNLPDAFDETTSVSLSTGVENTLLIPLIAGQTRVDKRGIETFQVRLANTGLAVDRVTLNNYLERSDSPGVDSPSRSAVAVDSPDGWGVVINQCK